MTLKEGNSRTSDELTNDPNYRAYQTALKAGQFEDMPPGTYVFFHGGQLAGTGMDRDRLFEEMDKKGIGAGYVHQVGVPERVVFLPAPLRETFLPSMRERVVNSLSTLSLVLKMWRINRKLDETINKPGKTDPVSLAAARQLMGHLQVVEAAKQIQSLDGSPDDIHKHTKEIMDRLSPAQQRAAVMVQVEWVNKLLSS